MVLGSFYYGFLVTQLPGGIISEKFGGTLLLGSMTALAGLLTLLNPLAARAGGIGTLVVLRVIQGLVQVCGTFVNGPKFSAFIQMLYKHFNDPFNCYLDSKIRPVPFWDFPLMLTTQDKHNLCCQKFARLLGGLALGLDLGVRG